MSDWKGNCWAKWRYCDKSACSWQKQNDKRKTFHNTWTNGFFKHLTFNWFLMDPAWPSAGDCSFLLMILQNLSVRNQSDMQYLREIIVLPLIQTRWKCLYQCFWLVVIWTCQYDQCIANTMKTPTTQQYHHYYDETDLMNYCKIFILLATQILIRKTSLQRWDHSSRN